MNHQKPTGVYIFPRVDKQDGSIFFQGRDWKCHLAGKVDPAKGWDKFLFTAAKDVLKTETTIEVETDDEGAPIMNPDGSFKQKTVIIDHGANFKRDFIKIMRHMATVNQLGEEITHAFTPLFTLYGPTYNYKKEEQS